METHKTHEKKENINTKKHENQEMRTSRSNENTKTCKTRHMKNKHGNQEIRRIEPPRELIAKVIAQKQTWLQ